MIQSYHMLEQNHYVYFLSDPRDRKVRYVGCSVDPEERFSQHLDASNPHTTPRVRQWVQEVLDEGLKPVLTVHRVYSDRADALAEELRQIRMRQDTVLNTVSRRRGSHRPMTLKERVEKVEELVDRYRALNIPLKVLERRIRETDPDGKGVSYVHLRRIMEGAIPTHRTLDKLEAGLDREEASRDGSATAAA